MSKIKNISVCVRLREYRQHLKLTQKDVANTCGVAPKTVSRWETEIPIPADQLEKLYDLGFDITYVITGQRYRSDLELSELVKEAKKNQDLTNKSRSDSDRNPKSEKKEVENDTLLISGSYREWDRNNENGIIDPILGEKDRKKRIEKDNLHQIRETSTTFDMDLFAAIPLYDVSAAAGNGSEVDNEEVIDSLVFKREWIHNELHSNPAHLYLIHVEGESMEPSLRPGDVILVDHTDNTATRDGIYVLRMDGALLVKRLQRLPGEIIKVSSDNKAYESFEIDLAKIGDSISIIGRVVWTGRRL